MKMSILIVDDHKLVRDGFKSILNESKHYRVISEACDGEEALSRLKVQPVDIIIMDIKMPKMDGLECIRMIRKANQKVKILVLSMYIDKLYMMKILDAGANGYLSKGNGKTELIEALDCVTIGNSYFEKVIIKTESDSETPSKMEFSANGNTINILTKREIEVLKLIIAEQSNREIADQLFVSVRTVDGHRRNLLLKAGAKNTVGLVKFGLKVLRNH
ncbi:MAG: response regulator transcription factor [Reichenbachiella sp.]|uniref:response regulator transcription factor n=1 Tax=Reichenbachiella sp. TaxID=2184521 RepID=UPI003265CEE0